MRIAINGMGRIGRLLFRRLVNHPDIELVAVNDIMDPDNLGYLLRYDSVYGTFPQPVTVVNNQLRTGEKAISVFQQSDPATLP